MTIKSIDPLSCGKVMAIFHAALGLLGGGMMALISLAGSAIGQGQGVNQIPMAAMGVASIIFFPLVYGIMGFVIGAVSALLYNLVAMLVGGIRIEFEQYGVEEY